MFSFSCGTAGILFLCSNKSWSKNWGQVEFVLGASLRHCLEKPMSINLSPMEKSGPLLDLEELLGCQMETRGCLKVVDWWAGGGCALLGEIPIVIAKTPRDSPRLHETLGRKVATAAKHRSHRDQLTRASAANPMFSWPHKKLRNIWHEDSNEFVASEYSTCSRLLCYCNYFRFFPIWYNHCISVPGTDRQYIGLQSSHCCIKNSAFDRILSFPSMWCLP